MHPVFSSLQDVTPDALTSVLERARVLNMGCVTDLKGRSNSAFNSVIAHLDLTYSADAPAHAPKALVLKINAERRGREEVSFYTLAQDAGIDISMLVPCFSAAYQPETGGSHLLLLDVSATHTVPVEREALLSLDGVPGNKHREATVEVLARFHAAWWEHPSLGKHGSAAVASSYSDETAFHERWERHRQEFEGLVEGVSPQLPREVQALYEGILDAYPRLWEAYLQPRITRLSKLTLTHNDCYLTQFLCPQDGHGKTYLVDFQSVCTDFAARDLVYLLATFWTPEQRRLHEQDLLKLYHQTLLRNGVTGYSFDDLLEDYKLMLTYMIFHPVWDHSYGADVSYWQPKMRCLVGAYLDLNCAELLTA